uniref:Uncharacterized protein n=1 Tax=Arundo donax TaxID=35708 RepID=A0A0A9ET87_ARUDO
MLGHARPVCQGKLPRSNLQTTTAREQVQREHNFLKDAAFY